MLKGCQDDTNLISVAVMLEVSGFEFHLFPPVSAVVRRGSAGIFVYLQEQYSKKPWSIQQILSWNIGRIHLPPPV